MLTISICQHFFSLTESSTHSLAFPLRISRHHREPITLSISSFILSFVSFLTSSCPPFPHSQSYSFSPSSLFHVYSFFYIYPLSISSLHHQSPISFLPFRRLAVSYISCKAYEPPCGLSCLPNTDPSPILRLLFIIIPYPPSHQITQYNTSMPVLRGLREEGLGNFGGVGGGGRREREYLKGILKSWKGWERGRGTH